MKMRFPALCVPGLALDCLGTLVPYRCADFLALAGVGQRVRPHHPLRPVVRVHQRAGRITLDLGLQPRPFRHPEGPVGRFLVQDDVQGPGGDPCRDAADPVCPFYRFSPDVPAVLGAGSLNNAFPALYLDPKGCTPNFPREG